MIDRFKIAAKLRSMIVVWLVLTSHLKQSSSQSIKPSSLSDQNTLTTTAYADDNQIINTIGIDNCGCLTNYEIKISSDTMFTGQLIRCTNVKKFNNLNLLNRVFTIPECSHAEQQFNEM